MIMIMIIIIITAVIIIIIIIIIIIFLLLLYIKISGRHSSPGACPPMAKESHTPTSPARD